jgi:Fur family peroxide stress response transcriptional regulator
MRMSTIKFSGRIQTHRGAFRRSSGQDRWSARFEEECRRRGIRVTAQRLAVYRALADDTTHPTADSVYARLREDVRGLSRATVYRILESLEEEGFIRRVSTTDGPGRFEANLAHHQHLVCRRCGCIMDWNVEALEGLSLPRRGPAGFVPEDFDIRIIGTCGRCRRSGGRRSK